MAVKKRFWVSWRGTSNGLVVEAATANKAKWEFLRIVHGGLIAYLTAELTDKPVGYTTMQLTNENHKVE